MSYEGEGKGEGGKRNVQEMFFDSPNLTRRRRRRIETNVTKNPTPVKKEKKVSSKKSSLAMQGEASKNVPNMSITKNFFLGFKFILQSIGIGRITTTRSRTIFQPAEAQDCALILLHRPGRLLSQFSHACANPPKKKKISNNTNK